MSRTQENKTEGRYELRGFELYLNGTRVPVAPAVVRIVIIRHVRETGQLPAWDRDGRAPIDLKTVKRILKLERTLAIARLAFLLKNAA